MSVRETKRGGRVFNWVTGSYSHAYKQQGTCDTHTRTHTKFDWETRRKFHLDKLSQLVEVLERGDDLQDIQ